MAFATITWPLVTKSLWELLRWQVQRRRAGLPPAPLVPTPRQEAELDFILRNAQLHEMNPAGRQGAEQGGGFWIRALHREDLRLPTMLISAWLDSVSEARLAERARIYECLAERMTLLNVETEILGRKIPLV